MLLLEQDVSLEKCLCCGLPEHMVIKPTKKLLRYHAYCPYCRFSAFLRKMDLDLFRKFCNAKDKVLDYSNANVLLFDADSFEFENLFCMFCCAEIVVKKCRSKDVSKKITSFGCKECSSRFFVPVIFLDSFYFI